MYKSTLLILFYFFFCSVCFAMRIDHESLKKEISELNDKNQNEKSILILEKIINAPNSTSYDLYTAYLLKSLTYKQLYNYTGALANLNLAFKEGQKSDRKVETETRINVEKIFIHFDLKNEREFLELIKQVRVENLKYIDKETRAFYECILGHLELRKGNYIEADEYFDACIRLLELESPKHLPIIYKVKVELYNKMGLKDKALESFRKGLDYANKYGIDIYKITMYETIIYYYTENKDYENAYLAQKTVSEARRQYDAANRSGKLNVLEKELLQQRNDISQETNKKVFWLFVSVIILLCSLIFVLFKLFHSNKQRNVLMEKELEQMRLRLENYVPEGNLSSQLKRENIAVNINRLKPRQIEIIELVKQGKTNKEIGAVLFISENTVKYHLKAIYELLEIDNRSELLS